jgi:hypothetical protein
MTLPGMRHQTMHRWPKCGQDHGNTQMAAALVSVWCMFGEWFGEGSLLYWTQFKPAVCRTSFALRGLHLEERARPSQCEGRHDEGPRRVSC